MNEIQGISNFPQIPKLPYPEAFAPKKKSSKIDYAMDKLAKFADSEELKSVHFIAEIVSNALSNISSLIPSEKAENKGPISAEVIKEETPSHGVAATAAQNANIAGTIADMLGILRGLESVAIIVQNLRKKGAKGIEKTIARIEIVQAFVDIINAVGSFLGIFGRFKVFELAKITEAMGKIPTIGQALTIAFPVANVFSLFSIVSSECTVIISILKIKQIVEKVKRVSQKINKWNQPIDASFAKNQGNQTFAKQQLLVQNALKLKTELTQMEGSLNTKKEEFEKKQAAYLKLKKEVDSANKVTQLAKKIGPCQRLKTTKVAYKKKIKKYQKTHDQLQALEKTHKLQSEKIQKWQAIETKCNENTLTEKEKTALKTMRAEKIKKWKVKKANEYWDIAQEVTRIALAVLAIALSIASIGVILAFTGNVPAAALIAMGTVGLSLTAGNLARSLFFNRIKKKVKAVDVPDFREILET